MKRKPLLQVAQAATTTAALAFLLTLTACASSAVLRYYTIEPVPAAAASAARASVDTAGRYTGPPLQLRAVTVPAALDRAELLREVAPGQFEVRESDHWAAPMAELARKALAENLAARLPEGSFAFPGAQWPVAAADLRVDIVSFEVRDGSATLVASWKLSPRRTTGSGAGSGSGPATPAAVGAQLRLQVGSGSGATETARALGALLGQLADRMVERLVAGSSRAPSNPL